MGKLQGSVDKAKGAYHEQMAKNGPDSSKGEHAAEAAKYKAKEKAEKHI